MVLTLKLRQACPDVRFYHEPDVKLSRYSYRKGGPKMEGVPIVRHHSPTGPNWGYEGSGPADAALSILAYCLPLGCDGCPPVLTWKGEVSETAWVLHQPFKRTFVVRVPEEGGTILGSAVDEWINQQLRDMDGADTEGADHAKP